MVKVRKEELPNIGQEEWYFTCSGKSDIKKTEKKIIIGRNIGYKKKGMWFIFYVEERYGKEKRIWVMEGGMASGKNFEFLKKEGRQ